MPYFPENLFILKTKTPFLCLQQLWHGAETIKLPKLSAVCDLASWNLCLAEKSGFYLSPISSFEKRFLISYPQFFASDINFVYLLVRIMFLLWNGYGVYI